MESESSRLPANASENRGRRSSWLKRILGLLAMLSVGLICLVMLAYWAYLSHGRKLLQVQFDGICVTSRR